MNTGQLMLIVGAMALLSTGILMMNNSFTQSGKVVLQSKLGITATSLASSVIEEATSLAFDKFTADSNTTSLADLTPSGQLGMEAGESYPGEVDDLDDYDNLTLVKSYDKGGTFYVRFAVHYCTASNPDVNVSTPTWNKKLTVEVSCPEMADTIKAEYVFSYWFFR